MPFFYALKSPLICHSAAEQTYRDFEWVIIGDGSADNTKEVVDGFIAEGNLNIKSAPENTAITTMYCHVE